jgi:hypothetical protein
LQETASKVFQRISFDDELKNFNIGLQVLVAVNTLAHRDQFVFTVAPKTVLPFADFARVTVGLAHAINLSQFHCHEAASGTCQLALLFDIAKNSVQSEAVHCGLFQLLLAVLTGSY